MIAINRLIALLVIGIAFSSCSTKLLQGQSYSAFKRIDVGGGSEDFLLDTIEGNRLLISCDERRNRVTQGSIWVYNLDAPKAHLLPFDEELTFNFHPHGIFLLPTKNATYLFVINHESDDKSEIDRFIVTPEKLIIDHRFTNIVGSPNDLFALSANEFYYSDDKWIGGSLVYFNGECHKIIKHLNYPNGVLVENNNLFYSTTLNGHLYKFDLNTNKKQRLSKVKGADNLMDYSENEFLLTSHSNFIKFTQHAINQSNNSPSLVYNVNKNSRKKEVFFYDDGSNISAASTALFHEGKLYLGQIFDPFILVICE